MSLFPERRGLPDRHYLLYNYQINRTVFEIRVPKYWNPDFLYFETFSNSSPNTFHKVFGIENLLPILEDKLQEIRGDNFLLPEEFIKSVLILQNRVEAEFRHTPEGLEVLISQLGTASLKGKSSDASNKLLNQGVDYSIPDHYTSSVLSNVLEHFRTIEYQNEFKNKQTLTRGEFYRTLYGIQKLFFITANFIDNLPFSILRSINHAELIELSRLLKNREFEAFAEKLKELKWSTPGTDGLSPSKILNSVLPEINDKIYPLLLTPSPFLSEVNDLEII